MYSTKGPATGAPVRINSVVMAIPTSPPAIVPPRCKVGPFRRAFLVRQPDDMSMEQRGEAFTLAVTDGPRSADLGPLTLLTMLPLYVARIDPLRSRLRHLAVLCRRLDPREPPYDCPLDEGRNFARCSLGQRSLRASLFGPPSCLHRAQRWHADHGSQPYHGASPPTPTGNSRPSAMTPASAPWIADTTQDVAGGSAHSGECRPGAYSGSRGALPSPGRMLGAHRDLQQPPGARRPAETDAKSII